MLARWRLRNPVAACVLGAVLLVDAILASTVPQHFPVALTCCPPVRPSSASVFIRRARVERVNGEYRVRWEYDENPDLRNDSPAASTEPIGMLTLTSSRIQRVGFIAPCVEIIDHRLRWVESPPSTLSQSQLDDIRVRFASLVESITGPLGGQGPLPDLLRSHSGQTTRLLPLGILHDLAALPIWAAAAYSVLTMPAWPFWQHFGVSTRATALRRGRCPRCGYDIRGLVETRCPECGEKWAASELPGE